MSSTFGRLSFGPTRFLLSPFSLDPRVAEWIAGLPGLQNQLELEVALFAEPNAGAEVAAALAVLGAPVDVDSDPGIPKVAGARTARWNVLRFAFPKAREPWTIRSAAIRDPATRTFLLRANAIGEPATVRRSKRLDLIPGALVFYLTEEAWN